jgi:hypothetical protein
MPHFPWSILLQYQREIDAYLAIYLEGKKNQIHISAKNKLQIDQ